jgi:hypothetical protein
LWAVKTGESTRSDASGIRFQDPTAALSAPHCKHTTRGNPAAHAALEAPESQAHERTLLAVVPIIGSRYDFRAGIDTLSKVALQAINAAVMSSQQQGISLCNAPDDTVYRLIELPAELQALLESDDAPV